MSKFEENIRKAFEQAEVQFNKDAWMDFDQRLDKVQMQDLLFTEKLSSRLNFAVVPYAPEHWEQIKDKLDIEDTGQDIDQVSKNIFDDAVYTGPVMGWDRMSAMLDEQELSNQDFAGESSFESKVKSKFDEASVTYKEEHWKDLLSRMEGKKRRVFWPYVALVAVGLGVGTYIGLDNSQFGNGANVEANNKTKTESLRTEKSRDAGNKKLNGDGSLPASVKEISLDAEEESAEKENILNKEKVLNRADRVIMSSTGVSSSRNNPMISVTTNQNPQNGSANIGGRNNGDQRNNMTGGQGATTSASGQQNNGAGSGSSSSGVNQSDAQGAPIASVADMEQLGVPMSEPVLEFQFTPDRLHPLDESREQLVHSALLPELNFWNNSAATGMAGEHNLSAYFSEDFKILNQYGEVLGTEFNQPMVGVLGYEFHSVKKGVSLGTFLSNKTNNKWNCTSFNVSVAAEKEVSNLTVRVAGGLNANRNQLKSEGLEFTELGAGGSSQTVHVAPETFVSANAGVMVVHEHYLLSYNLGGPVVFRMNYENEGKLVHDITAAGTANLGSRVQASALCQINYGDTLSLSPGVALTKDNRWLFSTNVEDMKRFVFGFGVQQGDIRTYVRYGSVNKRETGRIIQDLFAYNGTVVFGFNYTLK